MPIWMEVPLLAAAGLFGNLAVIGLVAKLAEPVQKPSAPRPRRGKLVPAPAPT